MNKLKISVFADPACTWCWGSVPVIRALDYRYGERVEISYVMGGMIEDILSYNNRRLSIGGDIALSNRNIHKHWVEASSIHGMPVTEQVSHLFSQDRRSTIPLNLAYIAAKVYVKANGSTLDNAAGRFLRVLQEMTAVDGAQMNDEDNIVATSALVGFEGKLFRSIYRSDDVKKIYAENKLLCNKYEVQSFPTYLLQYRGEEMMVRGFTTYETLCHCISQLSYEKVKPLNDGRELFTCENVRKFIAGYGSAYPVEVATAFALKRTNGHTALNVESYSGLPDVVDELIKDKRMAITPKGNGFMFYVLKEKETFSQKRGLKFAESI